MQNEPFVFCVMTHDEDGFFTLLRSAKRWGWPLWPRYLGGEKWSLLGSPDFIKFQPEMTEKTYEDFIDHKHLYIRDQLLWALEKGYTKFICLDGWDTKIVGPMEEVPFETGLIYFGGDGPHPTPTNRQQETCYPDPRYSEFFWTPNSGSPYPYPNGGVIWGDIRTYLSRCPDYVCLDQLVWTREYVRDARGINIDTQAQTVLNLFGLYDSNVWGRKEVGGRWCYLPTTTWPVILHGNGKWPIPEFIK